MKLSELESRAVALWGFGREGASVYAAMRRSGSAGRITVLDERPLPADVSEQLAADPSVSVRIGEVTADRLARFDVVVKSPGVSAYRPEITAASNGGTEFISATQLWMDENPEATVVAVTGTKGKSTTASLISHLLRAAGSRVELAGNIGKPVADFLAVSSAADIWVLELSSYQTQGLVATPRLAVLLNLYPEHLTWHGSAERYFLDKLNLFRSLPGGAAIVNREDPISQGFLGSFREPVFFNDPAGLHVLRGTVRDGTSEIVGRGELPLRGGHNLSNLCAALTVVRELGVELGDISAALSTVSGLPHRLQVLGERGGVTWVDDSISTIPESAIAALSAFAGRPISILLGGHERGVDMAELARAVVASGVRKVITLPDCGPRIAAAVREQLGLEPEVPKPDLLEAQDLAEAVRLAGRETPTGGVVLLSPAAASYGAFRDYRQRGREFARLAGFDAELPSIHAPRP